MIFELLNHAAEGQWYLKANIKKVANGKVIVLDDSGTLISRQVVNF